MKIGLFAPDSKIPNLPLMKIAAYHKSKGDTVELFRPLYDGLYDLVYVSKIFRNTSIMYLPHKQAIRFGGIGLNYEKLPEEIEHIYPDYSLYKIDYAMGYVTRGCNNACPFCVITRKEGRIHFNAHIEEFWKDQKKLLLFDNSITEDPMGIKELEKIRDLGIRLDLTQGFNIRTIGLYTAQILADIKLWDHNAQWHIAWDNLADESKVLEGIQTLNEVGIKSYRIMCYVLVGFNTTIEQDLHRIHVLLELGVDPFVMCYKKTKVLQHLARWCNRPQIRSKCKYEEYIKE